MKNGDLPAMQITLNQAVVDAIRLANETGSRDVLTTMFGLTKREQFAMAAMQGLVSSGMDWSLYDHRDVSEQAVIMADALLAELEKSK